MSPRTHNADIVVQNNARKLISPTQAIAHLTPPISLVTKVQSIDFFNQHSCSLGKLTRPDYAVAGMC